METLNWDSCTQKQTPKRVLMKEKQKKNEKKDISNWCWNLIKRKSMEHRKRKNGMERKRRSEKDIL